MATRHGEWLQETTAGETAEEFIPWLLVADHRRLNPIYGTEPEKRIFQRLISLEELRYGDIAYWIAREVSDDGDFVIVKDVRPYVPNSSHHV